MPIPVCHPDKPYCCKGLCRSCWKRGRRIETREHENEVRRRYYKNLSPAQRLEKISKAVVRKRRYRNDVQEYISKYKQQNPCSRCGFSNPAALQFHHRNPAEKSFTIGELKCVALHRVMLEIRKCEVLCANCHAIEHRETRIIRDASNSV